jgi:hypothetical protein
LIAVKRDFDVDVVSTRHGLRIEHECMRVKCSESDLESDLIEGMLCCDLGQINSIPNQNGTFLDLIVLTLSMTWE